MSTRSNDNLNVSTRSADNLLVSGKSEYEDEYIVPMNVVDMTNGVQYNIGQTKNVKKPSFLRSMVMVNSAADAAGVVGVNGGSTPSTARDPSSFRSMISNAMSRQVRRSFANGPTGIDSNMVVPSDEMVTTAQKMEMLNVKQQQQQQQQQQLHQPQQQQHRQQQQRSEGMMRVTSLENMDYEAMDIVDQSQASSSTKSESTQMVGGGGGPAVYRF